MPVSPATRAEAIPLVLQSGASTGGLRTALDQPAADDRGGLLFKGRQPRGEEAWAKRRDTHEAGQRRSPAGGDGLGGAEQHLSSTRMGDDGPSYLPRQGSEEQNNVLVPATRSLTDPPPLPAAHQTDQVQ